MKRLWTFETGEDIVLVLSVMRYEEAFLAIDPMRPNGYCTATV